MSTAAILSRIARLTTARPLAATHARAVAAPSIAPPALARAHRQALQRAASQSAGLTMIVLGLASDVDDLDALLGRCEPGLLLVPLVRPGEAQVAPGTGAAIGLLAIDPELTSALVEVQTQGVVGVERAGDRPATATDAALVTPCLNAWATELSQLDLAGWRPGLWPGPAWSGITEVAAALPPGTYRALRLSVDLGVAGRQGLALLLLPEDRSEPSPPDGCRAHPAFGTDRAGRLASVVMQAPVQVTACLSAISVPLSAATRWAPGCVLPLDGLRLGDTRLVLGRPGGPEVGRGHLGQMAGRRAVRRQPPPQDELCALTPVGHLSDPAGALDDADTRSIALRG